jgi:hypothetical protein
MALRTALACIMHFLSKFAADPSGIYNFQFWILNYLKLSLMSF